NVAGKSEALGWIAGLKTQQGEVAQAIALYQQSLELTDRIGDVQGKAMTLGMMGQLLADKQGDIERGLRYLCECRDILERLKSPHAATARDIIARVQQMADS
ncbi:MAG: tetratricopeptide repeat protein, partial [Spirulinaceae cyanobacterium SM2_1_0]|nr:tetratricopeptide repeat protein [Spirulinaceae cyanobacterium SM2_1_0]